MTEHFTLRTRWAALGAAVAITLGAGGLGVVGATISSGERTSFVPIEPCRMVDTRPGSDNVGPRATPLGAGEEFVLQARGAQGNCNLPAGATGIVANVTAVQATLQTNLRLFPTGGVPPAVSNLNPSPGAAPTPNAVTTDLNAGGQFSIVNFRGSVHVIVDIAGYYEDHNHDDRYVRLPEQVLIAPAEFVPDTQLTKYDRSHTVTSKEGITCFYARVEAPDGATITKVTGVATVKNPGDNLTVRLRRHPYAAGLTVVQASGIEMANQNSGPVAAGDVLTEIVDSSIAAGTAVVDNATYIYTAEFCLNAPDGQIYAYIVDLA